MGNIGAAQKSIIFPHSALPISTLKKLLGSDRK
jgi:hypothetical protein